MKRFSVFLIAIALIVGMPGCGDTNGSDTYADYIKIYDWSDLDNIRNNLVAKYVLMHDLDSGTASYEEVASPAGNGGKGWEPTGTSDDPFTGILDCQGHEIKNLFINRPDKDYVGLFGYVGEGGVIRDIGARNIAVTGHDWLGGLVGRNDGTVINSYSIGRVIGNAFAGGLVGINRGTVNKCYSTGNVTGEGYGYVGGLVAMNEGTLGNSYAAGIVSGRYAAGGLAGRNCGTVSDSYATASVISDDLCVGGLVGDNIDGTVSNSYSAGNVIGYAHVGGLVGTSAFEGTVNSSFWDTETSGQSTSGGGIGKTTAEMKDIATFPGVVWNIVAVALNQTNPAYVWNIVNNVTYPFLSWQPVS